MSSDARFMLKVATMLRTIRLDAVLVGNAASIIHCAPLTTQDIDLLVRDNDESEEKIDRLATLLGGSLVTLSPDVERIVGAWIPVDFCFGGLPGNLSFAAIKRRAESVDVGGVRLLVASLRDVIKSKEARDKPKDRAALPILYNTLAASKLR